MVEGGGLLPLGVLEGCSCWKNRGGDVVKGRERIVCSVILVWRCDGFEFCVNNGVWTCRGGG